jgi:hypothetical protein
VSVGTILFAILIVVLSILITLAIYYVAEWPGGVGRPRRSSFRRGATVLFVASLLCLSLPSASAFAAPEAEFTVEATNGHTISVLGIGAKMAIVVKGNAGSATYTVRGRASSRRLSADFDELGHIDMRFQARGRPKRVEPPEGCKGTKRNLSEGVFVGSIKFNGEGDYTRLQRKRVVGSLSTGRRWRCPSGGERGALAGPGGAFDRLGLWGKVQVLGAVDRDQGAVFSVMGFEGIEDLDETIFLGGRTERLGRVRIGRAAFAFAGARAFTVAPGLTGATVRPPKPFRGTAVFVRNADGAIEWSGPLTVSLLGVGAVPLTGPAFTADLAKPRTFAEYAALLGQPTSSGARR